METQQIEMLTEPNHPPCLSVLIPALPNDRKKTYETCQKAIHRAKALLKSYNAPDEVKRDLMLKLQDTMTRIPGEPFHGLGIFISPAHDEIVSFPFEVKAKAAIGNAFETRDLLYLRQYSTRYYVLNATKKSIHLFEGMLGSLHEIKDENFPAHYEDTFEYQRASIADNSSSLKGFEKEKTVISEIRLKAVFREAAGQLRPRMSREDKLFLAGTQKMLSIFQKVDDHLPVAGKIHGSFNENTFIKLRDAAWQAYIRAKRNDIVDQIRNLEEKKNGHLAEGLKEAWSAAVDGKGSVLLVEKDLHHRGFQKTAQNTLHLQPPQKPYEVIPDAVDQLIDAVQSKNGKVFFTENDQLKKFDHLALVLRY